MSKDLFKLAQAHQIEPLKQAIADIDNFDISTFFNDNFIFWSVEDIDFLGTHFDIAVNLEDNACFIKPDILDYFLEKGLKLNTECIERILTFDDDKRLAILLKHKVEIDASVIFNWPVFDKIELLKVYLENDGDPNVCNENEQSLIDYWYSVKGDCPAVTLLEEYGAKKSTDAMTLKEKMESISDMLKRAEEDPEFAEKLQAEYDKAMNKKQEKEEENE